LSKTEKHKCLLDLRSSLKMLNKLSELLPEDELQQLNEEIESIKNRTLDVLSK